MVLFIVDLLTRKIKGGLLNSTIADSGNEDWVNLLDKMDEMASSCKCLPACTSINYDTEISQADFNWQRLLTAFEIDLNTLPE